MKNYYLPVVLLLLALLMPVTASAYDFEVDGIYYNKNGTEATVTYKELKYLSYRDTGIIPSTVTYLDTTYTVTAIGNNAFENCSTLRKVTIPYTVSDIQERVSWVVPCFPVSFYHRLSEQSDLVHSKIAPAWITLI